MANMLGIGQLSGGLTLAALAEAKRLPLDLLRSWRWQTRRDRAGQAAVAIPWFDERGPVKHAPTYHLRHYVAKVDGTGPRFTWDLPKGAKLLPYGAWRIFDWLVEAKVRQFEAHAWVMESELDALTGWRHGVPAVAYGGTNFWRSDWAKVLAPFHVLYVVAEPGEAGQKAARRVALDLHAISENTVNVLVVAFRDSVKDFNALHQIVGGDTAQFQQRLRELILESIPASRMADEDALGEVKRQREERNELLRLAQPLLENPAVLHEGILTVERLGVVGERRNVGLIQLAVKSRSLKRPVNLEVNSPPSSGKTFVVVGALSLDPESAYYELTAGSERALIYLDEPLAHRILYIQEPEGLASGVGLAAIKSLVWEGRLKYDTVVQEDGKFVGRHIEKDGPTGLVLTTTRSVDEQVSNRMLRLEVDASMDQTRRILSAIAASMNGVKPSVDLAPWHALSTIVGGAADVEIAYGEWLSLHIATATLRIRRDFTHLLTLIQSSSVLHQFQRNRGPDGRIRANLADYAHVHALAASLFNAAQDEGITQADRDMVAAVYTLTARPNMSDSSPDELGSYATHTTPTTQVAIRDFCKLGKSQIAHRVSRLLRMGYLVNTETRRGRPYLLVPGVPLPEAALPLPGPCDLAAHLMEAGRDDLIGPWVDPITGESHSCFSHLTPSHDRTDRTGGHPDTNRIWDGDPNTHRTPSGHPAVIGASPVPVREESGSECQIRTEANRPGVWPVRWQNTPENENGEFPTTACLCSKPEHFGPYEPQPECPTCGCRLWCAGCGRCIGCKLTKA